MKTSNLIILMAFVLTGCAGYQEIHPETSGVEISLFMPAAEEVVFFSSADQFKPTAMEKDTFGFWRVTVPHEKDFSYFYQVDTITYIPDCREKERDDFGASNCLYPHR